MIEAAACSRFQEVAWSWLQSGEMTRTNNLLSPLEELCGFNYGFVYLMHVDEQRVKIGFSQHPVRRLRELQPEYGSQLRLVSCFVGEAPTERFVHRRFANLRVINELFYAHPLIHQYFVQTRQQTLKRMRAVHICASSCAQTNKRLDLSLLATWLARQ